MTALRRIIFIMALVLSLICAAEEKPLTLSSLFTDHMVLQRDAKLPVWGWTKPGVEVTVSMAGNTAKTVAGEDGKWLAWLPELKAGGPYEIKISAPDVGINETVSDVLIGDVWLCSGQSNMEWTLQKTNGAENEIASCANNQLRYIKVPKNAAMEPEKNFSGSWVVCSPETASSFTAVGYYFGKEINRTQKVPVGLINSSWGGTRVEPWTSLPVAVKLPECAEMVQKRKEFIREQALSESKQNEKIAVYEAAMKKMEQLENDAVHQQAFAGVNVDDSAWKFINTPEIWNTQGYGNTTGEAWYRKEVKIPEDWAGKELLLSPGAVDEIETTFFDGVKVGSRGSFKPFITDFWDQSRVYKVPADLVKAGKAVIAVRVVNMIGGGGMFSNGNADDMYLKPADGSGEKLSLSGKWRFTFAMKTPPKVDRGAPQRVVSSLFNGMINPLLPFPITGAIWYQGESNSGNAYDYRVLFPAMIKDWRTLWGKDFPFIWVQLANFKAPKTQPNEDTWAVVRESQNEALKLPNTATGLAIDIGEADNIHPRNKKDVGYRLALGARAIHYGEKDLVYSGPIYKSMKVEGNKIYLSFDHIGSGLVARGGDLKRFAIAGKDRKFVWAKARIEGDKVVVWAQGVDEPVSVRYAFETNPEGANLYNIEGLPASPFRTDEWKVVTQP